MDGSPGLTASGGGVAGAGVGAGPLVRAGCRLSALGFSVVTVRADTGGGAGDSRPRSTVIGGGAGGPFGCGGGATGRVVVVDAAPGAGGVAASRSTTSRNGP